MLASKPFGTYLNLFFGSGVTRIQVTKVVDRHSWKREEGGGEGGTFDTKVDKGINRKKKNLWPP